MSFILDALKKSEAERRQGEVPGLQNGPGSPWLRRRSFWPLVLSLALFLNGAVLGWWLLDRDGGPPAVGKFAVSGPLPAAVKAALPEPTGLPASAASPAPRSVATAPAVSAVTEDRSAFPQDPSTAGSVRGPEVAPPPVPEPAPLQENSQAVVPVALEPPATSVPSPVVDFPPLSELSADLRSGLPGLSLQLHFYSPIAENRLVRLNGVNLREGSKGADGLSVVEIVPEGVNLSRAGVRFFLPTARR
jgi:general secretion pathway protein B